MTFEARVLRPEGYPGEEVWVKASTADEFEIGVQENKNQYTYLLVNRKELEEIVTNIHAALLETSI